MSWSEIVRLFERTFSVKGWKVHPCSQKRYGSSLIENLTDSKSYLITGSDSKYTPIPLKRILRLKESLSIYKGKKIDYLIFLGRLSLKRQKKLLL